MADDQIRASLRRHAQTVDFAVSRFSSELDAVVSRAQAMLQQQLMSSLALDPVTHKVLRSAKNVRILKRIPQLWKQALDEAGLDAAVTRYLSAYPQQIPAFRDVLEAVNQQANEPLPIPTFSGADLSHFNALSIASAQDITNTLEAAANGAILKTVFSTGSIGFRDLTKIITDATDVSRPKAEAIADTALQGMYRAVAWAGFQKIENAVKKPILYDWVGPNDAVTSDKCAALLAESAKAPLTRAYIDTLEPYKGSPTPVRIFGFHYRCRHSFLISLRQTVAKS